MDSCDPADLHRTTRPATFTQYQVLVFPYLVPGTRYNLPVYLHHKLGDVLFTDRVGSPLKFCQDTNYEALDHRLVWLDYDGLALEDRDVLQDKSASSRKVKPPADGKVLINLYFGRVDEHGVISGESNRLAYDVAKEDVEGLRREVPPENILLLADFFRFGDSFESCWELVLPTRFSIIDCPAQRSAPTPHTGPAGRALRLHPQAPTCTNSFARRRFVREDLSDLYDSRVRNQHRLHLRAYFYDRGEGIGCHFVAITSKLGCGAVGLYSAGDKHCSYGLLRNFGGGFPKANEWQSIAVARAKGWHVVELVLQDSELIATLDDEPAAKVLLDESDNSCEEEHVWFGASGSPCVVWGGVELLHTPLGYGTWEMGVQDVSAGHRRPWRINYQEEGAWEVDADSGTVVKIPEEELERRRQSAEEQIHELGVVSTEAMTEAGELEEGPPAENHELEEASTDYASDAAAENSGVKPEEILEECEPVGALPKRVKAARGKAPPKSPKPKRRSASPPPAVDPLMGLVIDCWMLPGETELQRLDRVMGVFLEKLREAGVAMPDNISRIEKCSQPAHDICYVYNFGVRRLHIATREGDAGRITLVVRIGGGFIDFLEFVRRNGSIDKLKFERRPDSRGHEHIRLSSVLSHGRKEVKEMPEPNRTDSMSSPSSPKPGMHRPMVPVPETPDSQADIVAMFEQFDKNKNGLMDPDDLSQVLNKLDSNTWTSEALRTLLQDVDTNEDGLINYRELIASCYSDNVQAFTGSFNTSSAKRSAD